MSVNYERDKDGNPFLRTHSFGSHMGLKFRGTGVSGTGTKTTSTNIDYQLTEDVYMDGLYVILKDHVWGDNCDFQIIDTDGTTVLDQFGTSWYFDDSVCSQRAVIVPYQAKLLTNWYIRLIYNSVGVTNDVQVKMNLNLHKVP